MKLFFKIFLGGFVLFSTLVVLGGAVGGWWAYQNFTKPGPLATPVTINIVRGSNIGGVAAMLASHGALEYPVVFKMAGRLTEQAGKIKAGEYEIAPAMSMQDILDLLESGKVVQRSVTLREGLTSYEITHILSAVQDLEQSRLDMPEEGRLLPETYSYSKGDGASDIIRRMEVGMEHVLDAAWEKRADDLPFKTKAEALILASIIEKETAVGMERRRVAGVFVNRLRKGMLLQTDPTVIYALTGGKPKNDGKGPLGRRLLRKDLSYDSPYNTYKYAGLPPGPICNPGRAAVEAALNPETHSYLYFVADGSGGHAFAKSLAEHNRNVARWRRVRRGQ